MLRKTCIRREISWRLLHPVVPHSTVDEWSSRMSSLQQPSRSSPAPLRRSRRNGKAEQSVKRPAVGSEPSSLSRSSFDPSLMLGSATLWQPQRAVHPAEVVDRSDQPHPGLQRSLLTNRCASPTYQRGKPGTQGGLKPLDIRGVDHRIFTSLRTDKPSPHRLLCANDDAPNHPDHPSSGVPLDRLGYHEAFGQD